MAATLSSPTNRCYPAIGGAAMSHLKQHVFDSATDICWYCGADLQEADLPCDHALASAPDYFDEDDPRWQAEESENTLVPEVGNEERAPVE
jgi:hypothetical protein